MKVMVVGGTGHVGKFMVPMLVEAGCEVVVVGTGRTPKPEEKRWVNVKYIACNIEDSKNAELLLEEKPDTVIDMPGTAWLVYQHFKNSAQHIIACGSVWMFGEPKVVPTPEETQNPCQFEDYTQRYAEIQQLLKQSVQDGVAFTAIMPPNICGPGKIPLECNGGRDIKVHQRHFKGEAVVLPDGPEVLIGPCDAEDIAQCFVQAALNRDKAAGEIFNVGAAYALTASELVKAYSVIYEVDIEVRRVGWEEYIQKINPDIGNWWHFKAHMCSDISKAGKKLGYAPKYTPEKTLSRAVDWMRQEKIINDS